MLITSNYILYFYVDYIYILICILFYYIKKLLLNNINKVKRPVPSAEPLCLPDALHHADSSRCFLLVSEEVSWSDARRDCSARGGELAVVHSQSVRDLLAPRITQWVTHSALCFYKTSAGFRSKFLNPFQKIPELLVYLCMSWRAFVSFDFCDFSQNADSHTIGWANIMISGPNRLKFHLQQKWHVSPFISLTV